MSMSKLDELKVKMTEAVEVFTATGDMSAIQAVNADLNKAKADIAKSEATRLLAESEALAGKREALGVAIAKAVKGLNIDKLISDVKAKGYTYTIDHKETDKGVIDSNGEVTVKGGVGLLVSVIKTKKAGTGGTGRKGGLQEDFDQIKQHYPEAQAELDAALEKDSTVDNQGFSYAVKKRYQKKGIADGHLQPVK